MIVDSFALNLSNVSKPSKTRQNGHHERLWVIFLNSVVCNLSNCVVFVGKILYYHDAPFTHKYKWVTEKMLWD